MAYRPSKSFRESLRVTVIATARNLGASRHRIPRRISPLDFRFLTHIQLLIRSICEIDVYKYTYDCRYLVSNLSNILLIQGAFYLGMRSTRYRHFSFLNGIAILALISHNGWLGCDVCACKLLMQRSWLGFAGGKGMVAGCVRTDGCVGWQKGCVRVGRKRGAFGAECDAGGSGADL